MARQGRPERNRTARSFRQLRRFRNVINSDKVFGTHRGIRVRSGGLPPASAATRQSNMCRRADSAQLPQRLRAPPVRVNARRWCDGGPVDQRHALARHRNYPYWKRLDVKAFSEGLAHERSSHTQEPLSLHSWGGISSRPYVGRDSSHRAVVSCLGTAINAG